MNQDPTERPDRTGDANADRKALLIEVVRRMKKWQQLPDGPGHNQTIEVPHYDETNPIRAGDVKPGERSRFYQMRDGFAVNHALGLTMHHLDDSVVQVGLDGTIESTRPRFLRIELGDVRTVSSHRVNRVVSTTSHVIEFFGGGFFSFVMDEHGTIEESVEKDVVSTYNWETGVLRLHGTRVPDDVDQDC